MWDYVTCKNERKKTVLHPIIGVTECKLCNNPESCTILCNENILTLVYDATLFEDNGLP